MIATFIIDWPILMLIGLAFGSFAPNASWWRSHAFVVGLAAASAYTLVALVSYLLVPDWMWMYFIDPVDASWAVPVVLLGYLFVFALSFAAARPLRDLSRGALAAAFLAAAVLELTVVGLTWDRYHLIGDKEQWLSGRAHELFSSSPSGPAATIGILGAVFVALVIAGFVWTWRHRVAPTSDR